MNLICIWHITAWLTISRPELYLDNEVAFYADHLYLATVDHLPVHPQLQKNAVIVVIGEGAKLFHYREQCCLIVIEKDAANAGIETPCITPKQWIFCRHKA